MQLRRFTGDSMPTALGAVRQALGDEAIILSNRQVEGRIEIVATAMLDERALAAAEAFEPTSMPASSVAPTAAAFPAVALGSATAPVSVSDVALSASSGPAPPHGASVSPVVDASSIPPPPTPAAAAWTPSSLPASGEARELASPDASGPSPSSIAAPASAWTGDGSSAFGANATDENVTPLMLGRAVPKAAASPAGTTPSSPDATATVAAANGAFESLFLRAEREHAARAARLEDRLRRLEVNLWGDLEPLRAVHLRQLLRLGIGAELGVRLAESVVSGSTPETAMRRSLALLKASLPIASDTTGVEPGVTVLSGPAGGGKSTALVKLATRQVQREGNQSVVMIAADNRRIGAFESLQVYGRLLGVPVVQAHDGTELASLIEAFSHKSLVLVDHVPCERRDAMPLPEPVTLGMRDGETRRLRHLMVLPATLESRAFEALVERHVELGVTGGILTQLDRASRLGVCLAPLVRHQLGVAYWSDNARVQTPLEKASASVLVAAVMSTGGQLAPSVDEELLLDLLQPTRRDVGETLAPGAAGVAISATGTSDPSPLPVRATALSGEDVR